MARDRKSKTPKKRSPLCRILRLLLWTGLILFVIVAILITGVLLYLTPNRIESIAERIASEKLQQDLSFTNAHFNIFNGFVFRDIILSPPDSTEQNSALPIRAASAKEIALRYSFKTLLKKQLLITSALIDSPQVHLQLTSAIADTTRDFNRSTKKSSLVGDSLISVNSVVSFNLKKFRLKNAGITIDIQDSLQRQHIYLSDISVSLDDIEAPRGDVLAQDSLLGGRLHLDCEKSSCLFEQQSSEQEIKFAGILDAHLSVMLDGLSSIKTAGNVTLEDISLSLDEILTITPNDFSFPISVNFDAQMDAIAGSAQINSVAVEIDDVPWLTLDIQVDSLFARPVINAQVSESQIRVQQLITIARPFIADSLLPSIYLHNSKAFFSLAGSAISGSLPDSANSEGLVCLGKISLHSFGMTLNRNEHFLKNLDFDAEVSLLLGYNSVAHAKVTTAISFDSVYVTLPDNQKVFSGKSSLAVETRLNSDFFPTLANLNLAMSHAMGAEMNADFTMTSTGTLNDLSGNGYIALHDLDITPLTQSQVRTTISASVDISLNTLKNLVATVNFNTDSIKVIQEQQEQSFSPLFLTSEFYGATDDDLQSLSIRSLNASLNDFAKLELTGKAVVLPNMTIDLKHLLLSLDHAAVFKWLPDKIKEPIADLRLSGITNLSSQARLSISPDDTTYNANVQLETVDFDINYQDGFVDLSDVSCKINGRLNSNETADVHMALSIAQARSSQFTASAFRDNKIVLQLSMPNFTTVKIDSGIVQLPDLKTSGRLAGEVNLNHTVPHIKSVISLTQNATDTIRLMPDIYYRGKSDIRIQIESDSALANIAAGIRTADLSVSLPNDILMDQINSHFYISQTIDLQTGTLVISPQAIIKTPADGFVDYRLYRDYFFQESRNPSWISIRRTIAGTYQVDNIHAEAYFSAGTIEIPSFSMDIYGGNVGGSFAVTVDKDNILESSYKLSAHLAGINSALLLPASEAKSKGLLTAHTEITGKGFDLVRGLDMDGYFNITKIESKVANNLLSSLDPEGKDTGIKFTKLVMNYGYKPSLMTFDIVRGYCYPAVYFSQPWYNPVRLSGGRIELARIPVATILNTQR